MKTYVDIKHHDGLEKNQNSRNTNIEGLRILSMLMIICLQYFYQGGILDGITHENGIHYYLVWLLEAICLTSVNTYVLISGYFLYGSEFRLKKIVLFILETCFYSVGIYLICCLTGLERFNIRSIITAHGLPLIKGQWWFSTIYVVMYFFYPLLNLAIKAMNQNTHRFCIGLMFTAFSLIPHILFFSTDQVGIKSGYSLLWFFMLYITAAYIRKYNFKVKNGREILLFLALVLVTALIKFAQVNFWTSEYFNFYAYSSPTIYLASVCFFLFTKNVNKQIMGGAFKNTLHCEINLCSVFNPYAYMLERMVMEGNCPAYGALW